MAAAVDDENAGVALARQTFRQDGASKAGPGDKPVVNLRPAAHDCTGRSRKIKSMTVMMARKGSALTFH
jgi:hypothetical protein